MKRWLWGLIAALLIASPVQAQVAVDSVQVQIYAPGDIEVLITPTDFQGLVGDTVRFSAVAVDRVSGDTISAIMTWSGSEGVEIDPMTGLARFLTRGTHTVRVTVDRLGGMVLFELRGSQLIPIPATGMRLQVGQSAQLCAYVYNVQSQIVLMSDFPCPDPQVGMREREVMRVPLSRLAEVG